MIQKLLDYCLKHIDKLKFRNGICQDFSLVTDGLICNVFLASDHVLINLNGISKWYDLDEKEAHLVAYKMESIKEKAYNRYLETLNYVIDNKDSKDVDLYKNADDDLF